MIRPPPKSTLFPYPTLFRSLPAVLEGARPRRARRRLRPEAPSGARTLRAPAPAVHRSGRLPLREARSGHETPERPTPRSEEHTSELQSLAYLVCRLLLEKKK